MAIEDAFTLMKPDAHRKPEVLNGALNMILYQTKLEVYTMKWITPTEALMREHYKEVEPNLISKLGEQKGKEVYMDILDYMTGKYHDIEKILAIVFRGPNAIEVLRNINGATDPEKADPNSIRGRYGEKSYLFGRQPPVLFNVMHCCDSKKRRIFESRLFLGNTPEIIGRVRNNRF